MLEVERDDERKLKVEGDDERKRRNRRCEDVDVVRAFAI